MIRNRVLATFGAILSIACPGFYGQQSSQTEQPESLVVVSGASDIVRSQTGLWNSDGCDELKYTASSPFPGNSALLTIASELRRQGWTEFRGESVPGPGIANKLGVWEHWKNVTGSRTYQRTGQWQNPAGDHVTYRLVFLACYE
jgi:hypothetical protein